MRNGTAYVDSGRISDDTVQLWPSQSSNPEGQYQILLMLDLSSSSTVSWADVLPGDPDLEAVISEMVIKGGLPTLEDYAWADRVLGLT